jgi:broad specificity phosphatase PhoE
MKKLLLLLVWITCAVPTTAQTKPITTLILVRHAEKDLTQSTSDPDLSPEGKQRAARLAKILQSVDITAVYSTEFKRTRQTVEAVAAARSLALAPYDARATRDIDAMLSTHAGGTILVSGHSNTVPQFLNYLIGEEKYKPMGDGEYGNLIVVSVSQRGLDAKVLWLTY